MISRLHALRMVMLAGLAMLALRLAHLQLISGAHYRRLAEQNRLRVVPEPAPRGLILDRHGRVLAASQSIFRVAVVPQEADDLAALLAHVSALTHVPVGKLERRLARERTVPFLPATIIPRVPKEVALRLEEERWRWPGLFVKAETVRRYPGGSSAAHLLGYLSQPIAEDLASLRHYGVRPTSLIGRAGVEQLWDEQLRGSAGGLTVEVDHRARQVGALGRREPVAGEPVKLTIDAQLQSLIEASFAQQPGACVVLEPSTGAVLAMVSQPAFAPEAFAVGDNEAIQALLTDPGRPMLNRATQHAYTPGSIIKLVTAAMALERGVIAPSARLECSGSLTLGDRTFHCWNRDGHGALTLPEALMQSCNVYFMRVGLRLGTASLQEGLRAAGFGARPRWILGASEGQLPSRRLTGGEVA
ncbi:MAG: hypothetical protein HY601_02440, partial [Candidatus Omnitrophica bacterium]|nr:hypothetical protein [Candidatus Omnitrophota bacterium]